MYVEALERVCVSGDVMKFRAPSPMHRKETSLLKSQSTGDGGMLKMKSNSNISF